MKPQYKISWWRISVKPHQTEGLFEARAATATWMSPLYTLATNSASCYSSLAVFALFSPTLCFTSLYRCVVCGQADNSFLSLTHQRISVERFCRFCKQTYSEMTRHHILFLDSRRCLLKHNERLQAELQREHMIKELELTTDQMSSSFQTISVPVRDGGWVMISWNVQSLQQILKEMLLRYKQRKSIQSRALYLSPNCS